MIGSNEFAYAQARMQARLGARLSETSWQALCANVEFRSFLEQARGTSLGAWLASVAPTASAHEIERVLRGQFRERVGEVAAWVPAPWRNAVRFAAHAVDLPALEHLRAGRESLPWMQEETSLSTLVDADTHAPRGRLVRQQSGTRTQADTDVSPREHWHAAWRARLPRCTPAQARRIGRLGVLVRAHLESFAGLPGPQPNAAWQARQRFERDVLGHYRRAFLQPAAVFAFLLLVALDFERLRGALAGRLLFAARVR